MLEKSSIQFKAEVAVSVEDRRSWSNSLRNLSTWINNWERTFSQLGFGKHINGKFIISNEQLGQIINVEKTSLCLDGNKGHQCGGRPSAEFVDTGLPCAYKRTSKPSITVTFITGSSIAGEAIPPHFQFPTKSKTCNGKRSV